jgi:hypothetical protein
MNNLLSIIADVKRRPAAAYIERVETALGSSITETQKTAIGAFIEAEQVDGRWGAHRRLYLPIWANAAANAICLKSLTSGTFAGTITHGAGYVQSDGSTGYFNFGTDPSSLGLSAGNSSACVLILRTRKNSGASALASLTCPATGNVPTTAINAMAAVVNGTRGSFSNARYGAWMAGLAMTQPNTDAFTGNLKTLWETCTGRTLP